MKPSRARSVHVDVAINELAAAQHGVITRRQLLACGLGSHRVRSRVLSGQLRPIHRGVYLVGPVPGHFAREMAAVLACGPGVVVSHRSAGSMWEMVPPSEPTTPVELTTPSRNPCRRPGIVVYRPRRMYGDDVTRLDDVPVTTPVRTMLDLAAVLSTRELEQALATAERAELLSRADMAEVLARMRRHPGSDALRALIAGEVSPAMTRSEAEERFLHLLRKAQLAPPETNVRVYGFELDFFWRAERVAVEVDGFAYHGSATRFENDRRRDALLAARGIQVVRITWRQLTSEPEAVLVRLAQTLLRAELRATDLRQA